MDPRLLDYYNRELAYLREMGGEFAQRFPKVAARLGMQGIDVADPYVERLLEGFSFLAARIHLKYDAEFPRFSQRLLEVVYPNYLAPTPSMCVVQLQMSVDRYNATDGFLVKRDSLLRTTIPLQDRTACDFRTAHDITLWPIEIEDAAVTGVPPDLTLPRNAAGQTVKAALRLKFRLTVPLPPDKRNLDKLVLYLSGTDEIASHLYELIFAHCAGVVVVGDQGRKQFHLHRDNIHTEGFDSNQAMLPYASRSFQGHRLLHEYFAFPQRYWFFSVNGLRAPLRALPDDQFEIVLLLDTDATAYEGVVDRKHFELHCTPAINLFSRRADRIPITGERFEYHLVMDRSRPMDYEVYAVESVEGIGESNSVETVFEPFFSTVAGAADDHRGAFYSVRREPRLISDTIKKHGPRASYTGSEVFLSLVDQNEAPYKSSLRQLGVTALVTNRDLPLLMPLGQHSDFQLLSSSPVNTVKLVRGPTQPSPALAEREITWRLISHLSLNYLALTDLNATQGAEALRHLLKLYGALSDNHVRKQIDGILRSDVHAVTRRLPGPGPMIFGRGIAARITVDELRFAGTSPYLLGSVIEQFLARHVAINGISELTLDSTTRGTIHKWPPRFGTRPIA